jgi:hypothetical protein
MCPMCNAPLIPFVYQSPTPELLNLVDDGFIVIGKPGEEKVGPKSWCPVCLEAFDIEVN